MAFFRYWRGVIAVRINDAEKDHIRQQILQLYAVVEEQIAHHLSIAITKIFIGDEPEHNSGVLQLLLQPVHSNLGQPASAATFRALEGFRAIVKPWSRLHGYNFKASERIQLFRESAESIVGIVLPVWRQCVEAVMQVPPTHVPSDNVYPVPILVVLCHTCVFCHTCVVWCRLGCKPQLTC